MAHWACLSQLLFVISMLRTVSASAAHVRGRQNSPKSVVTSSYSVRQLASLNFTSNIKKYIDHEQFRLRVIKNFTGYENEVPLVKKRLAELKIIHKSLLKNATANSTLYKSLLENHPTSIQAAVRNFLAVWEDKLTNTTLYGARLREFLEENITIPLPTRADLHIIAKALIILQTAYNLTVSDLIKGRVLGKKGEPLSQADCYDTGNMKLVCITYYSHICSHSNHKHCQPWYCYMKKDQQRALKLLEKANELDPDNLVLYQEYVKHRFGRNVEPIPELNVDEVEPWRKKFYAMCYNSTKPARLKRQMLKHRPMKCRFRVSKSVPYARYKEEVLSKSPYISLILDFVSTREAETIQNETLHLLTDKTLPGIDPYVLWHYKGETISRLSQRAGEVTGLDVHQKDNRKFVGEPVIDFGVSGLALPHNELHMLSDVAAGGATVFIEQNITVIPKQGTAVLWYNYKPSGEPENSLLSATCPLAVGQNIVLEKGIWLQPNQPTSFCGRNPKSTFWTADRIQTHHPVLFR
ncbi:unnamed protein product [Candidula unifasciata]|uniref:Prolyl 4-hydroxylase alpha subunit domain-containing protein n=1 Tax=Candidula unifasciata TaxID=100452 RepID=A0A8S3YXJ6_9EUPU|nr:unnamed protein product [Candidula unifasciata]